MSLEVFKPQHPIITGDGALTRFDELRIESRVVGESRPPVKIGKVNAEITWGPLQLGADVTRLLESNGFNLESDSFKIRMHLRSFLAQSGLDQEPGLQQLRYKDGSLYAEVELRFLVDQELNGTRFPLEQGMRRMQQGGPQIEIANLVFIPEDAKPLGAEQIEAAEERGEMVFHDGRDLSDGLRLPFGPNRYQLGWLKGIDEMEWPAFFHDGKRFLVQMRKHRRHAGEYLEPGLNIRDIRVYASSQYRLLLGRDIAEGIIHSDSPFLVIEPDIPRLVEVQAYKSGQRVTDTTLPAEMYEMKVDTRLVLSKPDLNAEGGDLEHPSVTSRSNTLDELMLGDPSVTEFLRLVDTYCGGLAHGVLIGPRGAHLVPNDPEAKFEIWAKRAAKRALPLDDRVMERVGTERIAALTTHPGALAISARQAQGITHHDQYVYVSQCLPSPSSMRELAQYSGVGITTFVATELRDLTIADDHSFSSYTIHPRDLGQYRDLVEEGLVRIYWLPPGGSFKKLVGPTFVSVGQEEFYREMELVIALQCSGEEIEQYESAFSEQLSGVVKLLNELERRTAIVTAGSSALSRRLSTLLDGVADVKNMAIASLHYEEEPDFSPDMLIMSPVNTRRNGNQLLANLSTVRLFLNGGIGTSAALRGNLVDTRWGAAIPAPIGVIDLLGGDHWRHTREELVSFTHGPHPSLAPWVPGVVSYDASIREFFQREIVPYIENPLAWMAAKEIPLAIQKIGLAALVHHTKEFGRKSPAFLHEALRHYRLNDPT